MTKCPNIPTKTDIKVVHILREALRMEDCLQKMKELIERGEISHFQNQGRSWALVQGLCMSKLLEGSP